jgi:hypothetical protein
VAGAMRPVQVRVAMWVLFAASLLISGWSAVCDNHAVQIPLVNWLNDPSLYPHDPFMAVLARYPSLLWPAVAFAARIFPLEGMLIALFLLERLFVLYAAGRLARAFAPRSGLAVVASMALFAFAVDSVLGRGTIVESYFEQTGLSIAFLLMAAAAFEESRPLGWALWLAAAFDVNPMYGSFALSYFGAAYVFDPERRRAWMTWGRSFGLFVAVASPAVYAAVAAGSIAPSNEATWLTASRARCWHHFFPFYPMSEGAAGLAKFAVLLTVTLAVLTAGKRARPRLFRDGVVWSIVACVWLIDTYAAVYVLKSRHLMMQQPARATDVWICFVVIAAVAVAADWLERTTEPLTRLGRTIAPWIAPRVVALVLVLWVSLLGAASLGDRIPRSFAPADLVTWGPDPSVRQIAAWARANTPVDSVFLVSPGDDPDFEQFMGLSERSIFVNWEEGTALYWAPDYADEWTERLRALGYDVARSSEVVAEDQLDAIYRNLGDDDLERLKQRYRLSYWVAFDEHRSRFSVAFRSGHYQVLDVR